jgi:2-phospho-L-lactate/phosphoenolpyruvate guanylyltransferase
MDAALLVPVKAFHRAKARLSGVVPDAERARLARVMAERVVRTMTPAFVACDDTDVAEWAQQLGATVVWAPGLGLNGAVDEGVAVIGAAGFDHVVVAHGDLPMPAALAVVARDATVVLVPDRRRDGTNVLARPTDVVLAASYGGGSFRRHLDAALATGRRVSVRFDAELSVDLDTEADLTHPWVVRALELDVLQPTARVRE